MNADKIKTLLLGMAALNHMLIQETAGNEYWGAITDEFSTYLCFAGTELQYAYNAEADTQELLPVEMEVRAS